MEQNEYRRVIQAQIKRCKDVLIVKNSEYATEDALHNFRKAANLQGLTLRGALGGFLAKHTVSIFDMIHSDKTFSLEKWDEKITDHINYLLILRAVLHEEAKES